jgi:hypothetical protein
VGGIQYIEGLQEKRKTKDRGRVDLFSLLELGHPTSPVLKQDSWFLGFWTEIYIFGFLGSQALELGLQCHHWLPPGLSLQTTDHGIF